MEVDGAVEEGEMEGRGGGRGEEDEGGGRKEVVERDRGGGREGGRKEVVERDRGGGREGGRVGEGRGAPSRPKRRSRRV